MRSHLKRVLPVAFLLVAVAACSSVPARDYEFASNTYSSIVETMTALRAANKIDDESYRQITPVIHAVDAAFDSWRAAIESADPETGKVEIPKAVLNAVLDGIDQLVVWKVKLNKSGTVKEN